MNDPLKDPGIFQHDLIIGFTPEQISKNKKVLTTTKCCVYIKKKSSSNLADYQQIGLIQDLHITANLKSALAEVVMSFPKKMTKELSRRCNKVKKDLIALGVTVR